MDEAAKRRELQLILLREGFTQDQAREIAAKWAITKLTDTMLEKMRENAMRFPERQIVPPGTTDLTDLKTQHEEARSEVEEAKYFEKRAKLAALMAQSFSVHEMPTAVLMALLDVLEAGGVDRLDAMAGIIEKVEFLRKVVERERAQVQVT